MPHLDSGFDIELPLEKTAPAKGVAGESSPDKHTNEMIKNVEVDAENLQIRGLALLTLASA